jgi:hypothetical protein
MSKNESEPSRVAQPEKLASDLGIEWKRQSDRLTDGLGFHKLLGLSKEEYLQSLPKFTPQPEEYKGRFDLQVLVEPRIPLKDQQKRADIGSSISSITEMREPVKDIVQTLNAPYVIWSHDASRYRSQSAAEAEKKFDVDEVGGTLTEVTALFLQHPEVFDGYAAYALSSESGKMTPFLHEIKSIYKARVGRGDKHRPGHSLWGTFSRAEKVTA